MGCSIQNVFKDREMAEKNLERLKRAKFTTYDSFRVEEWNVQE